MSMNFRFCKTIYPGLEDKSNKFTLASKLSSIRMLDALMSRCMILGLPKMT